MIHIEQVASTSTPPSTPIYTPHGYLIAEDGTTYALLRQWWHGAMLALLYPEAAQEAGYVVPDNPDDLNVFEFQRFELDNHSLFPILRVCPGRLLTECSVDRGGKPTTKEQIEALRLVFKSLGLKANSPICTDHRDMKLSDIWAYLEEDTHVFSSEKREASQAKLKHKDAEDEEL